MNPLDVKVWHTFTYDDGRPGHQVQGVVVALIRGGFVAQFADRADVTVIHFDEKAWMDYITFD